MIEKQMEVSPTCEVWTDGQTAESACGKTTAYWYPTQRGTMALCSEHAQQHLPHAEAISMVAV
jgi:hypothetical protein